MAAVSIPALASADVNDFTVTSFVAEETLSRADRQGELHIIEHINVDFTDSNHGILRAIPNNYKHHSLQLRTNKITSDSGAPTKFTTYTSNGNTVLKIGDPAQTVTGSQQYTIDYNLRNVISFYKDHDELYWDVNGTEWQQQFNHVSVIVHLPDGLKHVRQPTCYAGAYGATSQDCTIFVRGKTIESATIKPLSANQTLTFVAGFPKGYFVPSTWQETAEEHMKQILGFSIPLLLIGGTSLVYWWRFGRDSRGRGTIIPQYDSPEHLKPGEVGTLMDFKLDNRDITATIIDLAIRGYIKIIEANQVKALRKDTTTYSLELLVNDLSRLDNNEALLIKNLFGNKGSGTVVDISILKNKLYTTASTLGENIKTGLTANGYFRDNSFANLLTKEMFFVLIAIAGLMVICLVAFGTAAIAGLIAGGAIAVLCLIAMSARTNKGVAAKEHVLGLKMYLEVAEKDRIAKLQSPNAAYASNAGEPVRTVELFEKLLPYAMVLGVEKQWAGKFDSLYKSPPYWYSGNWTAFNASYLALSLSDGIGSTVNSAFTAPSSSGSSGFGGGFSGGGGGGGGGGGW